MGDSDSLIPALELQRRVYVEGLSGKTPDVPLFYEEIKQKAEKKLSGKAFDYLTGGAGREETIAANRNAFTNRKIVPRMMRDVTDYDLSTTLWGQKIPLPLILAPVGVLDLAHRQADLAVSGAASSMGIPFTFSNQASVSMEICAAAMGEAPRWFQLYWSKSDELTRSLIRRAEACGCSALVVTLDTTLLAWRRRDIKRAYLPFLEGRGLAQYTSDPVFRDLIERTPGESEEIETGSRRWSFSLLLKLFRLMYRYPGPLWENLHSRRPLRAVKTFINVFSRPNLRWGDLERLKEWTDLPIVLKGILHPEDALRAIESGADGIWISNHGGRQVDGAIASLDALQNIREVLDREVPVILDSGIRSGADLFKALAMGADAAAVGRPYALALAAGGEIGVRKWLEYLIAEFELNLRLSGCRSIDEITPDILE